MEYIQHQAQYRITTIRRPEQLEVRTNPISVQISMPWVRRLYRAITGVEPFASDNLAELINLVKYAEPTPITLTPAETQPRICKAVIHWMMMKDPQERPQSHDDLI